MNCTIALIFSAYRNYWALDARVRRWTLDAGIWTLDAGLWMLDSGRWTLDSRRWTLDVGRWPLDADFKDSPDIILSELGCFSETKRYFNYSTNKNSADSFFITGKYHSKKQNITSHLKVFLKRATH